MMARNEKYAFFSRIGEDYTGKNRDFELDKTLDLFSIVKYGGRQKV